MNSAVLLLIAVSAGALQTPQIQNGRIETRQATAIENELARVAAGSVEPVWAGWRVPVADGQRGGCSTYSNESYYVRGEFLETGPFSGGNSPQLTAPPAGPPQPVQLEAASDLVILVRVAGGRVERLRSISADCPLDAGGRTVYWLQGPTPVESIKYLESLLRPNTGVTPAQEQRLSASAVSAIAMHRDPSADVVLDRLATSDTDSDLRRAARSSLGSIRGAHGFTVLRQLVERERVPDVRRQLVGALGLTRQTGTVDALLQIARRDVDAKVRGEAAYWLPQRGGPRTIQDVAAIINSDPSDVVKQRAIQGLARLTADETTSLLIQLARTSSSAVVKKEAVTALGRSKDPKALAYMEELIKGS
jgi:HEAT repeat protein